MSILVVGSVALDTITTPAGTRREVLGGSATHFSISASFFAGVRLVGVVGEDFGEAHRRPFVDRGVDLEGLETAPGRTFRWVGEYGEDPNEATTRDLQLNVFSRFSPRLPPHWRRPSIVFLANIDPDLQRKVLDQVEGSPLVAADTRDHWIVEKPDSLRRVLERTAIFFVNDSEIRRLTGERSLVAAAEAVRAMGPETVVLKKGEHGVMVLGRGGPFALPAFPLRSVVDPTGAGDSFAGGFLGHLERAGGPGEEDLRRGAVLGSVMASFDVEDFSLDRLLRLDEGEIRGRYEAFEALTRFGPLEGRP